MAIRHVCVALRWTSFDGHSKGLLRVEARHKVSILCTHKMQNTPSASPLPEKSFALQNLFRDFFILFLAKGARTPPSTPRPAHSAGQGVGALVVILPLVE